MSEWVEWVGGCGLSEWVEGAKRRKRLLKN